MARHYQPDHARSLLANNNLPFDLVQLIYNPTFALLRATVNHGHYSLCPPRGPLDVAREFKESH
ncbi:hypothetical protein PtB15_7B549 [Puccinia triticina]|nr:hypothetical protein PtB15_7B549 [Puccinia triticina]